VSNAVVPSLAVVSLLVMTTVVASCVAPRRPTATKPAHVFTGEDGKRSKDDADANRDPERATCTPNEDGRCLCVPGGFESGDETWDFACCFDGEIYVYFCGDDAPGCDAETFECAAAASD